MVIIMERTLEYLVKISKENIDPDLEDTIFRLWTNVGPDNMRLTEDKIKYVKIEE